MSKAIIILGSSRSFGNTMSMVETVIDKHKDVTIIDLNKFNILQYDYEHLNQADDYLNLMENILTYDLIVLATPVYWYTMSGIMKIFIDRLSDLLTIKKDLGRKLRNKKMFIIATFDTSMPEHFEYVFEQTAIYMGMDYKGCSMFYCGDNHELLKRNEAERTKVNDVLFEQTHSS